MEKWQKEAITRNLPSLLENTTIHRFLLTILQANNIITSEEADDIHSMGRTKSWFEQTRLLYDILMCRKFGYEALQEALLKTNQSVAYKILWDEERKYKKSSNEDHRVPHSETLYWQRKHLTENLPTLIESTIPNNELLDILVARSVLSQADKEYIKDGRGQLEQTRLLFEIVSARLGGYEAVQDALRETKQTAAYKILRDGQIEHKEPRFSMTNPDWSKDFVDLQVPELFENTKVSSKLLEYLSKFAGLDTADMDSILSVKGSSQAGLLYRCLEAKSVEHQVIMNALRENDQFLAVKIFQDWKLQVEKLNDEPVDFFNQEAGDQEDTLGASGEVKTNEKSDSKQISGAKNQDTRSSSGKKMTNILNVGKPEGTNTDAENDDSGESLKNNNGEDFPDKLLKPHHETSDAFKKKFKSSPKGLLEMLNSKKISFVFIGTADVSLTVSKIKDTVTEMDIKIKEIGYWRQLKIFLSDCKNRACMSGNEMMPLLVLHQKMNDQMKTSTVKSTIRIFGTLKAPINTKIVIVLNEDQANLESYKIRYFSNPDQVGVLADNFAWSDLTPQFQETLLQREVWDQGKPRSLNDFCNSFVYEENELLLATLAKDKLLIDLIHFEQFPVIFRETIPQVVFYIKRKLGSRYIISTSIFQCKTESEIFVFTGLKSIEELQEMGRGSVGKIDLSGNQLTRDNNTARFILLEREYDLKKICERASSEKNIHLLNFYEGNLIWSQTFGESIETLQTFVSSQYQKLIHEKDFLQMVEARNAKEPIIISDSPGMGKSVLLAKLAEETRKRYSGNSLVFYFIMTDFITSIRKQREQKGVSQDTLDKVITEEIIRYSSNYNLSANILSSNSSPNLYLFFDGLDELPPNSVSLGLKCFERIKVIFPASRLHVTTRPNLMRQLELSLRTLGYTIDPFDQPDQAKFLREHWSKVRFTLSDIKLETFGAKCLFDLKHVLTKEEQDFAGIPLQCYLVAEVFKDDAVEFSETENTVHVANPTPRIQVNSFTQLYELLVERKIRIFKSRHLEQFGRPVSELALKNIHTYIGIEVVMPDEDWASKLRSTFLDKKTFAGLQEMLPEWNATFSQFQSGQLPRNDILAVGILEEIDPGRWQFVHRTFAEYFIARFGSDVINQSHKQQFKRMSQKQKEFVEEAVLATIDSNIQIGEKSLDSFKFKYPVICHFIDACSFRHPVSKHKICLQTDRCERILKACINASHVNLLQLFIQNMDLQYDDKITDLLMLAAKSSSVEIFDTVRCNHKASNMNQPVLLQIAVEQGNSSLVSHILNLFETNNSLKLTSSSDLVPLCIKNTTNADSDIINYKIKILDHLRKHCSSIFNFRDHNGIVPFLQHSIHVQLITKLIQYSNTDHILEEMDPDFRTILHRVSEYLTAADYIQLLKTIESHHSGAVSSLVHYQDVFGSTPFQLFVTHQNVISKEIITSFCEVGADLRIADETGYTVLWTAIRYNRDMDTIQSLLQCDVLHQETKDEFDRNTLHIACQHYLDKALLELLINQCYDVNSEDKFGNSPLFYALRNPEDNVSNHHIRFLLSRNAYMLYKNKKGETVMHVAAQLGKVKSIELLLCLGFKMKSTSIGLQDKYGNTPLHHALRRHSRNKDVVVKILVDQFPSDVNQPNNKGQCPLHYALCKGNVDLSIDALVVLVPKISVWSEELVNQLVAFVEKMKEGFVKEEHKENTVKCENLIGKLLGQKTI